MIKVSSQFVHSAQIPYPENLKWLQGWYALQEVKIVTKCKRMRKNCKQNYNRNDHPI